MAVRQYSIYDAKARFSEVIRFVKEHGNAIITERGKPVAQISRLESEPQTLNERLLQLRKSGALRGVTDPAAVVLARRIRGALKRFFEERE